MWYNKKIIKDVYDIQQINKKFRYYQVKLETKILNFLSVTTILNRLGDSKKVEELREKLSPEMWEYVTKRGTDRGSIMHKYLELFLIELHNTQDKYIALERAQKLICVDEEVADITEKKFIKLGKDLFWNFWYENWFDDIKHIVFLEIALFSEKYKFAGTSDYCYINKNNQFIIGDFKSSTSKKTDDDIEKYKMQISAYMQALYEMYNFAPAFGEIKISYNNTIDTFIVKFEDRFKYLNNGFIQMSAAIDKRFQKNFK